MLRKTQRFYLETGSSMLLIALTLFICSFNLSLSTKKPR